MADFFNTLDRPSRDDAAEPADHGYLAWALDPGSLVNQTTQTAGVLYGTRLEIRRTLTVTNVVLFCSTAGSTLTSGQNLVGLYNSSGTRIGVSADQTTAWGTSGVKTAALASGPFALSAGYVWVVLVTNGTTPPQFGTGSLFSVGANAGLTAAGTRFASQGTSQTSLPASITPGSWLQNANAPWAALS
jgi:hypothetical protein